MLVIVIITIPLAFVLNKLVREASVIYVSARQMIAQGDFFDVNCNPTNNKACSFLLKINEIINRPQVKFYIEQSINKLTLSLNNYFSSFVFTLPRRILDLFIMFFIVFYLFKDGKKLVEKICLWLPIKRRYQNHILQQFKDVIWAVVYGIILVAFIQGILGGIGFFVSGLILYKTAGIYSPILLGSPIVWGLMMALFAMIPLLGTPIIWLPVSLAMLARGVSENNTALIGISLGLLMYCTLIVSTIDNILKPHIIGNKAKLSPALIILGIFGGIFVFGTIGIFIGPLVLGILATFIKIYEKERNELLSILQ